VKPYNKILNQPYSVVEAGRGSDTTFEQPRLWVRNACPDMWQRYKKDPQKNIFQLLWSEPNTSKFHGSVVYGEYVPFEGTRLVLIHNTNLKDQHSEHLQHWKETNYLRQHWRVMTIQGVDALLKRVENSAELNEQQQRDLDFIDRVAFVVLDELHRYSKNDAESIKMLIRIMDYMLTKNLKLALGTTATAKHLTAIWQWAGTYLKQSQYTYRTTMEELSAEGWKPAPTSYIWADSETTLEDEHGQWVVDSESEDTVLQDLYGEGHEHGFDKSEKAVYVSNRIDAGLEHYLKNHAGEEGIMAMNGIQNALDAEAKYQAKFEALGYQCIAWNSETKNDEKQMLADLFDETHPLRFVFVNGMLQEGTNKPFKVAYQANFSKANPDRSIQFGARAKEAYIIIDAPIMESLPRNPYTSSMLEDIIEQAKEQMDPEELQIALNKIEAAMKIEAARQGSINEDGKEPDLDIDLDAIFDSLVNGGDDDGVIINGNKVFVYDVNHKGNLIKVPLNIGNQIHRSLNQKAKAAIDVFGV
jgi:hypothetical protein|tara:strand:- start:139 stop:1722 length:1584 start_codon:yes stop_codon:yes gene_type:complete